MAITTHLITGATWTAISAAGESGTCWGRGFPSKGHIVITHSDSGLPVAEDIDDSYFIPKDNQNIVAITADNASDIFYATCSDPNGSANIVADVV